jgi:acid phosphatase family membrane protein YuiD
MNTLIGANISLKDCFFGFVQNPIVVTAFLAWLFAACAKTFVAMVSNRKVTLENFLGTGGMPSTHTSPVAAMALMVGFVDGFTSTTFAVAGVLMVVVMYDAAGIRRAAGRHARMINIVVKSLFEPEQIGQSQLIELRELLGHEPIEVAGGAVIGFLTAIYLYSSEFLITLD